MKKRQNRRKRTSDVQELRIASIIKSQLTFGDGQSPELFHLKCSLQTPDFFGRIRRTFQAGLMYERVYGPPFPKNLQEMFSKKLLYRPVDYLSEVIWSIARCLNYSKDLNEFVGIRSEFERSLLTDDNSAAEQSLVLLEKKFGCSLWLLEAKLSFSYSRGGIQNLYSELESLQRAKGTPPIAANVIKLITTRIESAQDIAQQRQVLESTFPKPEYRMVREYFDARIFGLQTAMPKTIAPLLFVEAHASLIDLYEALVASLQAIASVEDIPDEIEQILIEPVNKLLEITGDKRLIGVARAFGVIDEKTLQFDADKAGCIEAYTNGDYVKSVSLAKAIISISPDDMPTFVLLHKATANAKISIEEYPGLLGKISKNLEVMFQMGEGIYSAVHEILKISDRFVSLQWSSYIRSAVLYEIRQESDQFPPLWLRDIYVRDSNCSPFSTIAVANPAKNRLISNDRLRKLYPNTLAVYLAATEGCSPLNGLPLNARLAKHLAKFFLCNGNPTRALEYFNEITQVFDGVDRLRCKGGMALAKIQLGNFSEAANTIVDAYVENSNVPTCLPIRKLVDVVSDSGSASLWPKTIALPIILHLYHEYESNDKLANLRVAFERFQLSNGITQPEQLVSLNVNHKWMLLYLEKVWRPEVMRQTILYETSREIEEARIKVCQLLVRVDSEHEHLYLEEIKERVKRLEIAKGLKLVEQSKVSVDIPAIKKVVLKKLENPYRHYKLNQDGAPQSEHVAEKLAETLSQAMPGESLERLLGGLHILSGEVTSEEDVQFNSMYSEIRKEFLFGAHGLNAYLSTRVRHGVLANTLRKPVEDQSLVTSKNESGGGYRANEHWCVNYAYIDAASSQEKIDQAIQDFSRDFDAILDNLKDELLQVRVEDSRSTDGGDKALFVYRSSNVERLALKARDRHGRGLEYLVDRCVDHLWSKTDGILADVQRTFEVEVRAEIQSAFDRLLASVQAVSTYATVGDLVNAISLARTNTLMKLSLVSSWFKRSEVYDRQDYAAEFPVEVAHNMIRNTISPAADWMNLRINVSEGSSKMPGRTLDAMVYVFYGLIENAIKRSGLAISVLKVDVDISLMGGLFVLEVKNNINPDLITQSDLNKIHRIHEELESEESNTLAQREGLSGLHKVWIAANGPFYSNPFIDFGIRDDNFFVTLRFNIAGGST